MVDNQSNSDRKYYLFALRIIGDFGVAIAVPVVLFALAGQWLDDKYSSAPIFLIFGFVIAALVSARSVYRKAKIYGEEYSNLENNKKNKR